MHDETQYEAWQNRWLPMVERRSGELLWGSTKQKMDSLFRTNTKLAQQLLEAATAENVISPVRMLTVQLNRLDLVLWKIGTIVSQPREENVWALREQSQEELRQNVRDYYESIEVEVSLTKNRTRRLNDDGTDPLQLTLLES